MTALVSLMFVVAWAAAARTTDGAEPTKSVRWCSPTANRSSPTSSASRACSMVSWARRCAEGSVPVSGSAVISANVMKPISKGDRSPVTVVGNVLS
nr:hypothetical protein [Actinomadura spongiicola]